MLMPSNGAVLHPLPSENPGWNFWCAQNNVTSFVSWYHRKCCSVRSCSLRPPVLTVPTGLARVFRAKKQLMQSIIESTTPTNCKPVPLRGLRLWSATLLNQTELLPSKTFKFMEKYMGQLKEGLTELLKGRLVQLWTKEGIPSHSFLKQRLLTLKRSWLGGL